MAVLSIKEITHQRKSRFCLDTLKLIKNNWSINLWASIQYNQTVQYATLTSLIKTVFKVVFSKVCLVCCIRKLARKHNNNNTNLLNGEGVGGGGDPTLQTKVERVQTSWLGNFKYVHKATSASTIYMKTLKTALL